MTDSYGNDIIMVQHTNKFLKTLVSSVSGGSISQVSIFVLCTWYLWRLWRFSIVPKLYPNRPKTYPYLIPFIGHMFSFFRDGDGTVSQARLYFKNSRETFKLVIMGETVYVVTSPQDTIVVHKQVESLSMDEWVKGLMVQFGPSPASFNAMWQPVLEAIDAVKWKDSDEAFRSHSKEPLAHVCQLLFRLQLNPGEYSDRIQECVLANIDKRMTWEHMPSSLIFSEDQKSQSISLVEWSQNVLLEGATTSFFGKALLEVEPDLFDHFYAFDESSWKLSYRIPPVWANDVLREKAFIQNAMQKYFDLPAAHRADASWLVQSIEAKMRAGGIPSRDIGTLVLMFYWTINANAWKASFWMLTYIVNDPHLLRDVKRELSPIFAQRTPGSPVETADQLCECPTLNAVYNEVLRLTASSVSARTVVGPATIGHLKLDEGAKLIVPYRQMLLDESIFGQDANEFNHRRFLDNPALAKSSSFKPFGGGVTLCPGRHFAQREILYFVGLALWKFDLEKDQQCSSGHKELPQLEDKIPCIGIMGPRVGQDIFVRVQKC